MRNMALVMQAREAFKGFSFLQRVRIKLGLKIRLGEEMVEGGTQPCTFYLFKCKDCGRIVKDYLHGYPGQRHLNCPSCGESRPFLPLQDQIEMLTSDGEVAMRKICCGEPRTVDPRDIKPHPRRIAALVEETDEEIWRYWSDLTSGQSFYFSLRGREWFLEGVTLSFSQELELRLMYEKSWAVEQLTGGVDGPCLRFTRK